jgi:hypothetical protein
LLLRIREEESEKKKWFHFETFSLLAWAAVLLLKPATLRYERVAEEKTILLSVLWLTHSACEVSSPGFLSFLPACVRHFLPCVEKKNSTNVG